MGLLDLFKKKKGIMQVVDEDRQQLTYDMSANADLLIKQFRDDSKLDYSIESLSDVDQIIEDSNDFYKKADDETKRKMIIKIGSYIFEVVRSNLGGDYYWYDQLDQPVLVKGRPDFEMSLLAYEKVKICFEKGHKDSILSFFKDYESGVENKLNKIIF